MPRRGQPCPSPGGDRCARCQGLPKGWQPPAPPLWSGAHARSRSRARPLSLPQGAGAGLGRPLQGLLEAGWPPPALLPAKAGWEQAGRRWPRSCPAVLRAVNELERAETGLGPASLSYRQAPGINTPPALRRAPAPAAHRSVSPGSWSALGSHHHHRTLSPSPVPSRAGCRSGAQRLGCSVSAAPAPCPSAPAGAALGRHAPPGSPSDRAGDAGNREEGSGPADRWVTRVQFTRREGDRGTDGAMELACPSPHPRAAALPSTTAGARAPHPTCLAPPRLQRLLLLSPISPAPRARRPG